MASEETDFAKTMASKETCVRENIASEETCVKENMVSDKKKTKKKTRFKSIKWRHKKWVRENMAPEKKGF